LVLILLVQELDSAAFYNALCIEEFGAEFAGIPFQALG
jgi:hypothetical protein